MENSGRLLTEESEKLSTLKILETIIAAIDSRANISSVKLSEITWLSDGFSFFSATLKK